MSEIVRTKYTEFITGKEVLPALKLRLASGQFSSSRYFILVDENTEKHCLPLLLEEVDVLKNSPVFCIRPGEKSKSISTCKLIWDWLLKEEADRHSVLINLGGGLVQDLGGFVASTFKRGLPFINVPTSLLAQVDASFGGKVGVNFKRFKNLVGAFAHPTLVVIFYDFLSTLDERERFSGWAEVLKHGLIGDAQLWHLAKSGWKDDPLALIEILQRSIRVKTTFVDQDPMDLTVRKNLNFGHTFGHAIESHFMKRKPPVLHGEAVAMGMICETYLAMESGLLPKKEGEEITQTLLRLYKPFVISKKSHATLLNFMQNDKKNSDGKVNVTLLNGIGEAIPDNYFEESELKNALNYYTALSRSAKK